MRDVYDAGRAVQRGAWGQDGGPVRPEDAAADLWPAGAADVTDAPAEPAVEPHAAYAEGAYAPGGDADDAPPGAPGWDPTAPDAGAASAGRVTRRAALKVLGVLPAAAGALAAQPPVQQHPGHVRQPHATPNQPATEPAVQPPNNKAPAKFFTAREARTAGVLADDIIPKDDRSGSATEAGVVGFIDYHMTVPEATPEQRTAMRGGLRWLDTESRRRHGVAYDKASEAQRHAILDDISQPAAQVQPRLRAGAAFFSQFRSMVGAGFFSSAVGHRDLQYKGNVFNPGWNGCPQPALDKLGVSYAAMDTRVKSQVRVQADGE